MTCRVFAAIIAALAMAFLVGACTHRDIRGSSSPSPDGKTYLVIDDDNGGHCGGLLIDDNAWQHALHAAGQVQPGVHQVACGEPSNGLAVRVDSGTTYHFNYWGP